MSYEKEQGRKARPRILGVIDYIGAGVIILAALSAVVLVSAFYFVVWQTLSSQSRPFIQAWAIIATTLIIIASIASFCIGIKVGAKRTDFMIGGIKLAVAQVIHAAEQVSEVRVATMRGYRGAMSERKGTQEWLLPQGDIFGVMNNDNNDNNDPSIIDMPTSEKGRKAE